MNKKNLYESIMKDVSKIVKKHLNEAVYNNPEKDEQRIQSIIDKANGDSLKMMSYAFRMALSIKDLVKLEAHMDAAMKLLGEDHIVTKAFNAVLNNSRIEYGFFDDMSEEVKQQYNNELIKYALNKHRVDKQYFEIVDGEIRYSPDSVLSDDVVVGKYPGEFIKTSAEGIFIQTIVELYKEYIDVDAFNEEIVTQLFDNVSGFPRATVDDVIEFGYTKSDFEDEDNFDMMPTVLKRKFE